MTRKKAIEYATAQGWEAYENAGDTAHMTVDAENTLAETCASAGWEFGFAAGLMEGARMAMRDGGWTPTIGEIQKRARAMNKKLKAKKC